MSHASIKHTSGDEIATDSRSEVIDGNTLTTHVQKVQIESNGANAIGVMPEDGIFVHLKNAGSSEMAVDGSSVPVVFEYVAPVGRMAVITRLLIQILDNGAPTITEFGNIAALTNGLTVQAVDSLDVQTLDFTDGHGVKSNGDFGFLAGTDIQFFTGSGDDGVLVRWSIDKAMSGGLCLESGKKIQVVVRDNLTALSSFEIFAQGRLVDVA